MSASAEILNAMFAQKLDDPEGKAKLAAYGGTFIRDRLREESFARKVLPPQPITRADCQRSEKHEGLVKIIDIEPESRAMTVSFRGQPTARLIDAPRFSIPFFSISSEKFEKFEQELLSYEMPITKIIEDNSVKDIQEIEDREFLRHVESSVQLVQAAGAKYEGTDQKSGTIAAKSITKGMLAQLADAADQTSYRTLAVQKTDFTDLFKLFTKNGTRLECDRVLLTDHDFEDILSWTIEDFGDKVQGEVVVGGYKYNTLMGRKFIRTIKGDILRDGNVYAFTTPDFFGRFYILNNTKFYIDKVANKITWQAWEDIAMGIGNVAAVRKLELYAGSSVPSFASAAHADSTTQADVLPKSETDLGKPNNLVESGGTRPKTEQF